MDIDYTAARFWFDAAHLFGLVALGVYTWVVNRTKANRGAINQLGGHVSDIDRRLSQLESEVRHLPDHEDLGKIHEKVNGIAFSMAGIEKQMNALNTNLRMLFEDRLQQGNNYK